MDICYSIKSVILIHFDCSVVFFFFVMVRSGKDKRICRRKKTRYKSYSFNAIDIVNNLNNGECIQTNIDLLCWLVDYLPGLKKYLNTKIINFQRSMDNN